MNIANSDFVALACTLYIISPYKGIVQSYHSYLGVSEGWTCPLQWVNWQGQVPQMSQITAELGEGVQDLLVDFFPSRVQVGGNCSCTSWWRRGERGGGVRGKGEEGVQLVGGTGHMIWWNVGMSVQKRNSAKINTLLWELGVGGKCKILSLSTLSRTCYFKA